MIDKIFLDRVRSIRKGEMDVALTTGFNPDEIRSSIGKVNDAYANLCTVLGSDFQNKFISLMSQNWACQEAQNFFNNAVNPTMTDIRKSIDTIFESVVTAMDSAAYNWAMQTGNDGVYTRSSYNRYGQSIDVSIIRENINGVRGINEACMSEGEAVLQTIVSKSSMALDDAINGVSVSGFIGGDQQASLTNALEKIKSNIETSITNLTSELKSAVDETIAKYSNTGVNVSSAFGG